MVTRARPLLEREPELGALAGVLRSGADGTRRLVVVEGATGIGKSALLSAARAAAAAAGRRVLAAAGSVLERELAFGVVRQLFEPVVADPAQRASGLRGAAAPVFTPSDDVGIGEDVSFGVLHGLFGLVAELAADRPMAIVIDDLHWSDLASLRFIAYLARRLEQVPVVLVAAVGPGEPGSATRLVHEVAAEPGAVLLHPRALSDAAVAGVVGLELGAPAAPAFAVACHRATGGNPLLLQELLRTLRAEGVPPDDGHVDVIGDLGPRAVSRTVLLRLARLGADATAVARAVAVLGGDAGLPATARVAALTERRAAKAVQALAAAEIVRPDPPLEFVHPLVRAAVHRELPAPERDRLHARAATVLHNLGTDVERVAAQLLAVAPRGEPWAAAVLTEAGLAAGRRGAAESAVAFLRRALAEPPRPQDRPRLLLELGLAEARVDIAASVDHLRAAHAQLTDPEERAATAEVLGRAVTVARPPQEAVLIARAAMRELPAGAVDRRRALQALELYAAACGADVPDAAERIAAFRTGLDGDGVGANMLRAVVAWKDAMGGGGAGACADLASRALADGTLIVADPGFMSVVAAAVLVLADREEALGAWDAMLAEGRRLGSRRVVGSLQLWRGWTWLQRGDLDPAEASLRSCLEGAGSAQAAACLARTRLERGQLAGARAALRRAGAPIPASPGDVLVRRCSVELLLAEDRWAEALSAADGLHGRLRGDDNPAWVPWRSLRARALEGLGRRGEAVAALEDELRRAREWGAPGAHGAALRRLGTRARDSALLEDAVAVTANTPARLEHAKALIALGTLLRHARQSKAARAPLREGYALAARCGAARLAREARAELRAAGARPRREALTGQASLTPSERRVAALAASGHSNRVIAQRLFVTPKTVEVHLTSVYRKLGVRTRAALPENLGGVD